MNSDELSQPTNIFYQVRDLLLELHKELLLFERTNYESIHGRITTNGDFLTIIMSHSSFSWLRKLSELIVLFDEYIHQKASTKEINENQIFDYTKKLLLPDENGEEFAKKYFTAIQKEPGIAILQLKIKQFFK